MNAAKILKRYANSAWYDFCHIHPSLHGVKKRDVKWMVDLECALGIKLDKRKLNHQRWIFINIHNSDYDAVYIHSRNPNRDNYPYVDECGRITKANHSKYNVLIKRLKGYGYLAHKVKGQSAIVARSEPNLRRARSGH